MTDHWTAKAMRYGSLEEHECDTFREAVSIQRGGLENGLHSPVSIIAPDGTVAWDSGGGEDLDDLAERLERELQAAGRVPITIRAWIEFPVRRREITITIDDQHVLADLAEAPERRRAELIDWRVEREVLHADGLYTMGWDETTSDSRPEVPETARPDA